MIKCDKPFLVANLFFFKPPLLTTYIFKLTKCELRVLDRLIFGVFLMIFLACKEYVTAMLMEAMLQAQHNEWKV